MVVLYLRNPLFLGLKIGLAENFVAFSILGTGWVEGIFCFLCLGGGMGYGISFYHRIYGIRRDEIARQLDRWGGATRC